MQVVNSVLVIKLLYLVLLTATSAINGSSFDPLEDKYGKLIHVSLVFRHGDRSPFRTYPQDPYPEQTWADGNGQLFEEGKRRLFLLGEWLGQHYKGLLRVVRHHTDLRIDSSNFDRTIMSAQCLMAGFYPPEKSQILKNQLNWQPVPVHVTPKNSNMISVYTNCPAAEYYSEKYFRTKNWEKKYNMFKSEFSYMEKHSGFKFQKNIFTKAIDNAYVLWDVLTIEKRHNLTLPKWTKKVYPTTVEKIMRMFLYKEMRSLKIQRMLTGRIFKSMTADMLEKVKNPNLTNTFHLYSGHETLLASVLNALGTYDSIVPQVGALIMFEVRKKGTTHIITIKYMKSLADGFKLLQVPKCKAPCTLNNFLKMLKPIIPRNVEAECQIKKKNPS